MNDLNLGLIGNSTFGALIDRRGRVVWACFPRFDGDPVFSSLVNEDGGEPGFGFFDIAIENFSRSEQHYLHNTAILITTLYGREGAALEITDFAPRFKSHDRIFRPLMMVRHVRPVIGHPRFRIRLRPAHAYNAERPQWTRGSNHVRYVAPHMTLRCTTDAPVAQGRHQEARELFENMLECRNHLGLLSEDIDPDNGELWGNFPQTYSMVGLINSAMRLSKSWREAF